MSAKVMYIPAKAVLYKLHEVKVLQHVDAFQANCDSAHVLSKTLSTKFDLQDIVVSLDNSCSTSEQKAEASKFFLKNGRTSFRKGPLILDIQILSNIKLI